MSEKTSGPLPGESDIELSTQAMKAFAHPLRMAMFSYLNDHGSATATTLAKQLNESTGQTSYHLRQLEKHGLVVEDLEKGTGRERWWKATGFSMRRAETLRDPANRPALETLMKHQLNERFSAIRRWMQHADQESEDWFDAAVDNTSTFTMNAEETRAMMTELMQVLEDHTNAAEERTKTAGESAGDRRVRAYLSVFPLHRPDQG